MKKMRLKIGLMISFCCFFLLYFPCAVHGSEVGIKLQIKPSAVYSDGEIPERSETAYYRNLQDALSVARSGDTLLLTENLTQTEKLNQSWGLSIELDDITLDLNGHTYKDTVNTGNMFQVFSGAGLIVKNTGSGGGLLQSTKGKNCITVQTGGKLTVLSGEIKNSRSMGIGVENSGAMMMYGGTVTSSGYSVVNKGSLEDADAYLKIYDGTLTAKNKNTIYMNAGKLMIYGGRLKSADDLSCIETENDALCQSVVRGGVYSGEIPEKYLSEDYTCCMNDHEASAETYPWKVVSEKTVRVDAGCGTIDANGDLNLSDDFGQILGCGTYRIGDRIVLTAPVKSGWQFSQWYQKEGDDWIPLDQTIPYACQIFPEENVLIAAGYTAAENDQVTLCVEGADYTISGTIDRDGTYSAGQDFECTFGSVISLTADNNADFISWLNDSDKIADESGTYTFTAVRNGTIKAYRLNAGQNETQLDFFSSSGQLMQSGLVSSASSFDFPVIQPAGIGKIFNSWIFSDTLQTADEQSILQRIQSGENQNIKCEAVVEDSGETCNLTLIYPQSKDTESFCGCPAGEVLTVQADLSVCPTGEKLAYWTDGENNILCFSDMYQIQALSDRTLTAQYIDEDEETAEIPVLNWQDVTMTEKDQDMIFKLTAGRTVPDDFEVLDHGILYAAVESDALTLENSNVDLIASSDHAGSGSFTGEFYCTATEAEMFFRAYMIVQNENDIYIFYTDIQRIEG